MCYGPRYLERAADWHRIIWVIQLSNAGGIVRVVGYTCMCVCVFSTVRTHPTHSQARASKAVQSFSVPAVGRNSECRDAPAACSRAIARHLALVGPLSLYVIGTAHVST